MGPSNVTISASISTEIPRSSPVRYYSCSRSTPGPSGGTVDGTVHPSPSLHGKHRGGGGTGNRMSKERAHFPREEILPRRTSRPCYSGRSRSTTRTCTARERRRFWCEGVLLPMDVLTEVTDCPSGVGESLSKIHQDINPDREAVKRAPWTVAAPSGPGSCRRGPTLANRSTQQTTQHRSAPTVLPRKWLGRIARPDDPPPYECRMSIENMSRKTIRRSPTLPLDLYMLKHIFLNLKCML